MQSFTAHRFHFCMHLRDALAQNKMSSEEAGDAKSLLANVSISNPRCILCFSACLIGVLVPDSEWLTIKIKIQLIPWGMLYCQIKVHTFGILKMHYYCSHSANAWHKNWGQWSLESWDNDPYIFLKKKKYTKLRNNVPSKTESIFLKNTLILYWL